MYQRVKQLNKYGNAREITTETNENKHSNTYPFGAFKNGWIENNDTESLTQRVDANKNGAFRIVEKVLSD